ncbi:MAG: glycosyltransferase, partial [Candidatus Moranbacteria bacterium]|nr:glycosyltransferase [Candidatus Moranbacteria bacterium]
GVRIDLVTSSVGEYEKINFSKNITIYRLDINKDKTKLHSQSNLDLLKYSWKAFWFCRKLKKKKNYDLVHAFFGIPCGFLAMLLNVDYIVSLRGSDVPFYSKKYYWLDFFVFRFLSKLVWSRAAAVVANSEGLKELALKNRKGQAISVIYNGVDVDKFKTRLGGFKKGNIFKVVSASRLVERKGFNYALKAFIKFNRKYPNSRLIFAGDGPMKGVLIQMANKAKLKDKVVFLGVVDRDRIQEVYQDAYVFILPSLNEGMSNSLLEAMASGLAIITTNTGGTRELIDETNGIIVKKRNAKDIYLALEKLYKNRKLLNRMRKSSRKKAERMSWEIACKKYLDIYKRLIKK